MAKKILLVDDEEMILDTFEAFLSFEGYEVFTAFSVKEARAVLEKEKIDLVLSDLRMPGEDGIDLLKDLNRKWPHLAAVMITGSPEAQATYDAYEEGIVEFLIKPVSKKQLVDTVARILSRKEEVSNDPEDEEIRSLLDGLDI